MIKRTTKILENYDEESKEQIKNIYSEISEFIQK